MEKPTRAEDTARARRRVRSFLPPLSICAFVLWAFYPLGGDLTQQKSGHEHSQDSQDSFRWSDVKLRNILGLFSRLTFTR